MSKEHYITPEEFHTKHIAGELGAFFVECGNQIMDVNKRIIDSIRKINKKDPGFKYSCECTVTTTIWLFGYTNLNVYKEANKIVMNILAQNVNKPGINVNFDGEISSNTSVCVCPFQTD